MKKKLFSMLLVFTLVLSILMPDVSANAAKKKKIKLNEKEIYLEVDETFQLKLKNAKAKKVKWSSDDKEVATVNSKGLVKGTGDGLCNIIAKYKGKKYFCEVDVTDWYNEGDEYEEDNEDWDDDDWNEENDDNYSDDEISDDYYNMKLDFSSMTSSDGFLFSHRAYPTNYLSYVYFDEVSYDYNETSDYFTVNYKAHSEALTKTDNPIDITYWFTYKIYDEEGYVIESDSFYLPNMYVGGKVKSSFIIYRHNGDFSWREKYRLSITPSD